MSLAMAEEIVSEAAGGRLRLDVGNNLLDAILGYVVVFIGLSLLMAVVMIVGKVMTAGVKKAAAKSETVPVAAPAAAPAVKKELAPGSAGEVKLYDTDPRDAAMIMAIVAEKMQKPLNELRFVSIKEVK